MSLRTRFGISQESAQTPFAPDGGIPQSNAQEAIKWVYTSVSTLLGLAQYTADDARERGLVTGGYLSKLERFSRLSRFAADEAREQAVVTTGAVARAEKWGRYARYVADLARTDARTALGIAARAETRVRKVDELQIALKAQVFN